MKRKLISMICALSMVISVVSGMAMFVQAADGSVTVSGSVTPENVATIKVEYSLTNPINAAEFKLPLDETIFDVANIKFESPLSGAVANYSTTNQRVAFSWNAATSAANSGTLLTITVPVLSTSDVTYPLAVGATNVEIIDNANGSYGSDGYATNAVTINDASLVVVDPDATPAPATPTPRPTIGPRPTMAPTPTPETPLDPVNVNLSGSVENGVATIVVKYDMTNPINAAEFKVPLDETIFDVANIKFESPLSGAVANYSTTNKRVAFSWNAATSAANSGTMLTITVPVLTTADVTYPVTVTANSVEIIDNANNSYGSDGYATNAVQVAAASISPVTPTTAPTAAPAGTDVKVEDAVGSTNSKTIEDSTNENLGLNVTFKDKSGDTVDAKYGTDFVVVDKDGDALSEDEWNNIKNGYDNAGLKNLLDGGKFVIYNGNIASLATDVIDYSTDTPSYVGDTNDKTVSTSPTPKPTKAPTGTWNWGVTSVKVDNSVELDTTYTDPLGTKHEGDDVKYTLDSGSSYANLSSRGVVTGKKKGTAKITATTTYTDANGVVQTVTDTYDFKIKDTSSKGGGSSSDDDDSTSGGGDVANGNLSNTPTVNNTAYFTDLYNVPWAETAINGLASKNIVNGKSEHLFDPEANVTRAEFAKMLVSTFGFTNFTGATSSFADVPESHWAYQYVSIAYTLGAITGYDATTFGPNDNITRQDMAVMIYRLVTKHNVSLSLVEAAETFSDDASIAAYAKEAVSTLQQADVINGMGDGTFAPTATATRAQAAVMLWKFVK